LRAVLLGHGVGVAVADRAAWIIWTCTGNHHRNRPIERGRLASLRLRNVRRATLPRPLP
jgi:hypothetical protein